MVKKREAEKHYVTLDECKSVMKRSISKTAVFVQGRLQYVYEGSSDMIKNQDGRKLLAWRLPPKTQLSYPIKITFLRLKNGWVASNVEVRGLSPWFYVDYDDYHDLDNEVEVDYEDRGYYSLCTTAIRLDNKLAKTAQDLQRIIDTLVDAAQSCALADVQDQASYDNHPEIARILKYVKTEKPVDIDWLVV